METDRLRLQMHAALDECFARVDERPSQKYRILNRIEGEANVKKRIPMNLVPVLVVLLALCGGVVASELGIFGRFGLNSEYSGERLAHLDEAANRVGTTARSDAGFALTLEQAYCDGDRLYFAYTLEGERVVLGDGAELKDGTNLTIWDRGDETDENGVTRGYQEVELPQGAADGGMLTVVLTVIRMDAEGAERYVDVPFEVEIVMPEALNGSAAFAEYTAEAEITVTDVEVYGEVAITGPQAWKALYQNRADTDTEDYVVDYLLIADGETLGNKEYLYGAQTENSYGVAVRYDLPQSMESLVLRPVRYLSGECPEEDITLR